ncbi:MAG: energy-coupling factor ABC transporter ATP-binding protein [Fusobacteriaceae bacterium]|jgi:energy-coupling factor transport system ATP-binding protein|nr:energy-coupling factor ABC transporter ATP-binding protein [Fusobacteriaceae bacterium]
MEYAITCKNVNFKYNENGESIISDFSYDFEMGKIYIINGYSGCGKSTLLNVLSGLYPENAGILLHGTIKIFGKDINDYSIENRALELMVMFQNVDSQFCMDTVKDEIIFVLENINCPPYKMDKLAEDSLSKVGILHLKDRKIYTLSGGEKQKLALAVIISINPKIIILDEPFSNIDYESSENILEMLYKLNKENNTTIIAVEHRANLWKNISYELISVTTGCKITNNIDMNSKFSNLNIKNRNLSYFENKKYALEINSLNVNIDNLNIFDDATLKVKERSITSIIGRSGTGKTTLFKIISGINKIKNVNIKLFEIDIKRLKKKEIINMMGIVFQNPQNQFVTYRVIDEIIYTLRLKYPKKNKNFYIEEAENLLKKFNLEKYINYSPFSISQGQQRKLAVLSMLAANQKIMLFDEPTYGQDDCTSDEIMDILKEKALYEGLTVIIASHDLDLVYKYSDYIYIINESHKIIAVK